MSSTDNRPRLVLVIGSLCAGGAERQLVAMANFWAGRGMRVTLATWSGPDVVDFYPLNQAVERVHLDAVPSKTSMAGQATTIVRGIGSLRRLLRRLRPDAVVSFIDVSNVCCIVAAMGLGLRVVVAERTHPAINRTVSLPWRVLRRLCYRAAACVVAQTQDAARWLERACSAHVVVIPNSLRPLPAMNIPHEKLILGIGRLSVEKGFDTLLEAFANVRPGFPDWRVCIIGDGSERDALLRLREKRNLSECVELIGKVSNVEWWLARAALLVHPSRREGFPNVVLEAMGMGLAVICTDCPAGPSELIRDGVNGRLIRMNDVDALTRAMAELMSRPELREALGREARSVTRDYAEEAIMEKWQLCVLPSARAGAVGSRKAGAWERFRCGSARLRLSLLRLLFRFEPWHAAAPYECRPYKSAVVGMVNALQPAVVVELGCGLGDIISRVGADERIGVDRDPRVIRAARFLHPHGCWIVGDASNIPRTVPGPRRIDCIIMVNWTHSVSPEDLAGLVLPLLPCTRHLLLDAVDTHAPPHSYKHRHDFGFLATVTRRVAAARVPGEPRTFIMFETL